MKKFSVGDFIKKYNLLVLLLVFIIISSVLSPNFLKLNNMLNMMQQCAVPGVIAIGMTVVITLGGIDLSVGGVAAFSGMVTSLLVVDGHNILLSIVVGVVLGAIMGFVTVSGKSAPQITTPTASARRRSTHPSARRCVRCAAAPSRWRQTGSKKSMRILTEGRDNHVRSDFGRYHRKPL